MRKKQIIKNVTSFSIAFFLLFFISCFDESKKKSISHVIDYSTDIDYSVDGKRLLISSIKNVIISHNLIDQKSILLYQSKNLCQQAIYSNDGKKIVFTEIYEGQHYSEIFIMNQEGGNVKQITFSKVFSGLPIFSKDDSKIYFIRKEKINYGFKYYSIELKNLIEKEISPKIVDVIGNHILSEDSKSIYFVDFMANSANKKLVELNINTGNFRTIVENQEYLTPILQYNSILLYGGCNFTIENEFNKLIQKEIGIYTHNLLTQSHIFLFGINWESLIKISRDKTKYIFLKSPGKIFEISADGKNERQINIDESEIIGLMK